MLYGDLQNGHQSLSMKTGSWRKCEIFDFLAYSLDQDQDQ